MFLIVAMVIDQDKFDCCNTEVGCVIIKLFVTVWYDCMQPLVKVVVWREYDLQA